MRGDPGHCFVAAAYVGVLTMVGTGHNRAALENLYAQMQRIRVFEELALAAHKAGELPGYLHPSIGQEAVPAGVCAHLKRKESGAILLPPEPHSTLKQGLATPI